MRTNKIGAIVRTIAINIVTDEEKQILPPIANRVKQSNMHVHSADYQRPGDLFPLNYFNNYSTCSYALLGVLFDRYRF